MRSISADSASASSARRRSISAAVASLTIGDVLSVLDSRVDHAVQDVGEEVAEHDPEAADHDEGEHDGIVARIDRGEAEQAEPRPAEDRLGNDRAGEQAG